MELSKIDGRAIRDPCSWLTRSCQLMRDGERRVTWMDLSLISQAHYFALSSLSATTRLKTGRSTLDESSTQK